MKILIYGLNYTPELVGVGTFTGQMAEWLTTRGHQVQVITTAPHYPDWRFKLGEGGGYTTEHMGGVSVSRCPMWLPEQITPLRRILACCTFVLSSIPVLIRALSRQPNVLVVIEPTLLALPLAVFFGKLSKVPVWLHIQDFEIMAAGATSQLRRGFLLRLAGVLEGWLMRRVQWISTLTEEMDRRLAELRVDPKRRLLLPNWVNCDAIFPLNRPSVLREALGIGPDEIVLLYSGSFGRKHGLGLIIEAAKLLRNQSLLRVVMCGAGPERDVLQASAADLPGIIWLPLQPMEALNELLNLADIHLLPQRAEVAGAVLPSKLTGMLASGRPVVASTKQGSELAKIVAGAGIVVSPGDAIALTDAIRNLAADAPRRMRFGTAGRRYAEAHFSRDSILARFEATLHLAGTNP